MTLALFFSLIALASYAALLVIVSRRGLRVRVNQLFALYLASMLLWQLGYIFVSLSHTTEAALHGYRLSAVFSVAQFLLFCFFARALLRIRERLPLVLLGFLIWLVSVLAVMSDRAHFIIGLRRDEVTGLIVPEYGALLGLIGLFVVSFLSYGIVSLAQGYRRAATDIERNRLRYLLVAIIIILLGAAANVIPQLKAYPIDVVANIVSAWLFAYAILRYQLLDITLVVRRGLAYTVVTIIIAVVYVLSIFAFEGLARTAFGGWAFGLAVGVAMLAALLVRPWRERVQVWIDRLFFRDKYDTARMLRELSRRTATVIDLETLGSMLLSEVCQTMHLQGAALFLREASTGEFFAGAWQGLEGETLRLGQDHPLVQRLQLSEQPLRSSDLDLLPQFRSLWYEEKEALARLGAQLFIPLLVKDGLVGILAIGAKLGGGSLSSEDEGTLVTLANQTAVAVENAHLFASTRARVAQLTALQEIGVRLVSSHSLPQVLRIVADSAIRLLGADEAYVNLQAGQEHWVGQGITANGSERTLDWQAAEGQVIREATHRGRLTVVADLRREPIVPPGPARESHIRALAICPLRRGEAAIGSLAVLYHQPQAFAEEELRLLGLLSDHASLAIDNARLLESEQAKRQLADTLRQMSGVIGSTLELDVVLELVLEQLRNVVNYDSAVIMLMAGNRLEVSNIRGFPGQLRITGRTLAPNQHPLLEKLLRQPEPIIIDDIQADNASIPLIEGLRMRALVGVPLVVRDQARGILAMAKVQAGYYDQDDVQNAVAFANQAAVAIENARLYRETIEGQRKTETILRETMSGIVVTDVNLIITTFNIGAEAITGYKATEAIGRRLPEVLGTQVVAPGSPLGQVMATGKRVPPQEAVVTTPSGSRDILQGAVALRDGDYEPFGYLISFSDVTRLKEVDRLKTDIVANVSHELRTPLASIKAYTELLLHNIEGEDRALRDQFLSIIDQETDRLSQLIGDLLNLSRLEAGRFEVRRVPIRPRDLLAEVLPMLEVQRRNQEVTIRVDAPTELPIIRADREMLTMIAKNLVSNAIKFSRRRGEVVVSLQARPECLVLQVADRGIGIPAEAIPNLFQKFYRAHANADVSIEGTGLGLVLVKQAVEAHGGTVEVESELEHGSTFTVRLPWK